MRPVAMSSRCAAFQARSWVAADSNSSKEYEADRPSARCRSRVARAQGGRQSQLSMRRLCKTKLIESSRRTRSSSRNFEAGSAPAARKEAGARHRPRAFRSRTIERGDICPKCSAGERPEQPAILGSFRAESYDASLSSLNSSQRSQAAASPPISPVAATDESTPRDSSVSRPGLRSRTRIPAAKRDSAIDSPGRGAPRKGGSSGRDWGNEPSRETRRMSFARKVAADHSSLAETSEGGIETLSATVMTGHGSRAAISALWLRAKGRYPSSKKTAAARSPAAATARSAAESATVKLKPRASSPREASARPSSKKAKERSFASGYRASRQNKTSRGRRRSRASSRASARARLSRTRTDACIQYRMRPPDAGRSVKPRDIRCSISSMPFIIRGNGKSGTRNGGEGTARTVDFFPQTG